LDLPRDVRNRIGWVGCWKKVSKDQRRRRRRRKKEFYILNGIEIISKEIFNAFFFFLPEEKPNILCYQTRFCTLVFFFRRNNNKIIPAENRSKSIGQPIGGIEALIEDGG
jgi:hypothetical protein